MMISLRPGKNISLWGKLAFGYISGNRRLFVLTAIISLLAIFSIPKILPVLTKPKVTTIGMVGNYTVATLPKTIQEELSFGLVKLDDSGLASAAAASDWSATDSGKTLTFNLYPNLKWQDGQPLTSGQVNYNLRGVEISRPTPNSVRFTLKEPFSPLVALLSQPLFKNGLVGLSNTRVRNIRLNGRFLSSIELENQKTGLRKIYKFYSSEKNLIAALKLGAVREITGLHSIKELDNNRYYSSSGTIEKNTEVVIFFNNQKKPLDEKSFRQGLVYALPEGGFDGEQTFSPIPKDNWAFSDSAKKYPQNIDLAKKFTEKTASQSGNIKLVLNTNRDLEGVAKGIAQAWQNIGITTSVQITDLVGPNFDAYLTYLDLPADPDQYAIWHSTQTGNIAGYKSFKVDKLLEEGRKATDQSARESIYADFQRAISEDVPAAFLYHPKTYTVTRN